MFNTSVYNESLFNVDMLPSPDHYLFSGSYRFFNRQANRVAVIGSDSRGNPVFGEQSDLVDLAYSGERLTFRSLSMLATEEEVMAVAGVIQSGQRFASVSCLISCPPNCGAELYDVVRVFDLGLPFQGGACYRIAGISNTYEAAAGDFRQRLELCAV